MSSCLEANQPGSCSGVSENNVISNLPEKMDFYDGKVVDGDLDGHLGSRAVGYVQQMFLKKLLEHPLLSSNPNVSIDETYKQTDQDYGVVHDMRNGHGDSRAANLAEFLMRFLKGAVAVGILQNIPFAMAQSPSCNNPQVANAQQLTSNGNAVDPSPFLTTAKVALLTLFAGGLGAVFIWKRFFPTFSGRELRNKITDFVWQTLAVDAGLEASPAELGRRRSDLDSIYPRINEC